MAAREEVSPYIRRQFDRLTRAQVQLAEEVGLLTATIQHSLPPIPQTARKSKKQIGKFGALTTTDANRKIAVRKQQEDKASERKTKQQRTLGLQLTPSTAAEEA